MLGLLVSASCTCYHADSFCRRVTRVLSVHAAAGSLECVTRFKLLACHLTSHVEPAHTRICQRLRRALIRSQPPPVLNERFRALSLQGLSIRRDLRPYLLPPVRWFRHVRILLLCPYAARCPVPVAGDDAEVILELSFSWHADDGRLDIMVRPESRSWTVGSYSSGRPLLRSWPDPGLLFSLHAAVAGGLQPTSVSAPSSRAAGPHVWRH